jgi:hypothetical protein
VALLDGDEVANVIKGTSPAWGDRKQADKRGTGARADMDCGKAEEANIKGIRIVPLIAKGIYYLKYFIAQGGTDCLRNCSR